jgi:hypothetical protein
VQQLPPPRPLRCERGAGGTGPRRPSPAQRAQRVQRHARRGPALGRARGHAGGAGRADAPGRSGRDAARAEVEGLGHFLALGCIQCHFGSTIGGTSYQKIGRAAPYPTEDLGRFEITKRNSDRFAFKVPSLRNVEETGPWFHDGAAGTLDEAIRWMARYQLGTALSDEVVASLRAFLVSLTGAVDAVYTQPPELPPPASAEGSRREPKASDGEPPEDVS